MNNERIKKIQRNVRKIISDFVIEELPDKDNIFGIINISDIILSPDWKYLDIKVSSFKNSELLCKTLAKYAHIIQRYIWKKIALRITPRVRFRYDNSGEISSWVNKIISEIEEEIK